MARAADVVLRNGSCSVQVELITRLADFQAHSRAALLKKRDLRADRLILVIAGSRANRRALLEASDATRASFSLGTRELARDLRAGRDPGGDGIMLL